MAENIIKAATLSGRRYTAEIEMKARKASIMLLLALALSTNSDGK